MGGGADKMVEVLMMEPPEMKSNTHFEISFFNLFLVSIG